MTHPTVPDPASEPQRRPRSQELDESSGKRQRRKFQIQQALADLLATKAFNDVQITEVASRVGISSGNVYNYYTDKESILRDAVEARVDAFAAKFDLRLGRSEKFVDYLTRLVDSQIELWSEYGLVLSAVYARATDNRISDREWWDWWQNRQSPWVEALREAVEELRFAGELSTDAGPTEPLVRNVSRMVVSACHDELPTLKTDDERAEWRDVLLRSARRILGDPV